MIDGLYAYNIVLRTQCVEQMCALFSPLTVVGSVV